MIDEKYFVIDSHCHIYPEKIAEKAVGGTDGFYDTKSFGRGTVKDLISLGTAAGVDHFVVQSVATTPAQVKSINEFIAREVNENPDILTGLGTLHPDSSDIEGDVNHLRELGLKGIKLHPDIQDFKIDDYRNLKIYELCEKHSLPILMHTGDNRYDRSNPNRLYPILKIYEGLTLIGAHFGGWSIWEEASEKLSDLDNLYVDCSSSFNYITPEVAKKIICTYGTDRVMFATDYPMWDPQREIDLFMNLGFSEEDNRKMFGENARKLFGIE